MALYSLTFKNAFDILDHETLVKKCRLHSRRSNHMFMSGRQPVVCFIKSRSNSCTVDTGVPQDSILGASVNY